MNIFKNITAKVISRLSANLIRVSLLLTAFLFSSVSIAAEPVCAVVKIEIQQELTLERQAFDAVMRINNGLDILSLENVNINVTFKDETGTSVEATSDTTSTTAKFFITVDSMTGISDISGFGSVAPKTTAEVHWLIIPAPGAGGLTPSGKLYFIGATLSYNLGGELQTTTVTPDSIFVKPLPLLSLDYFLEKDVFADDAFTPEVEPAVPFTLGVRVKNNGAASASGLKIDSAQPTITENVQGLLIGFNIIGSHVNEAPSTNSLLIDFGEIKPNEATMGRWDMVTTLSGRFTEFTADFSHADALGGRLTSLIDPAGITTHTLVRNVRVDVAGRDLVRDFLALDGTVYRVYESSGVDTDVTDVSASSILTPVSTGTEVSLNFTMPVTAGFAYAKVSDPYAGAKVVKQMVRSDGKAIPLDNVWTSKTRNLVTSPPSWDYWFNVFDANSTGAYALLMGAPDLGPVAPEFTPMSNITTFETAIVTFPVTATDANGDAVSLTAGTLPTGASFTSDTSGSGTFTWTPAIGQAGNHIITFTASDGTLTKQASVNIKVNPVWDTDGDGMDDAWEIQHFGDLSRDGLGDLDGDGVSDLQEYLNQTDPDLVPPLVPTNLVALPGNAENTLSWDTVTGVDAYNVYWSLTADVSPTQGSLVNAPTSPFVHTGLDNDVTYYYTVTSVGAGGESAGSNVVSVTTGVRDWTAPFSLQNNSGATFTPLNAQIAMSVAGEAIAVWQQTDNGLNSIWSSRYVPLTGWATPVVISDVTVDASSAKIAMDADGNALVVWHQVNVVQTDIVATRFDVVTGVWDTAAAIETDDTNAALNPQIVISKAGTNAGNALVVWQQGMTIMSNTFVAQTWQTAVVVSTETVTDLSQLTLSMNENGDAFAAWVTTADQTNYDLRVTKFSNNIWDATVVTLATGLDNGLQPALDINATGAAVMAWPERNATTGTRHVMMASQFDVSTGWGVAEAIEANLGEAKSAQVAMDANGNAFVAWAQSGSPYSIYVNRLDASLGFAASATLIETRERGDAAKPQLVIDNRGNAIVSWQYSDGVQQNILAAVYNNTDSTWGIEQLIETTNAGDAIAPAMAVSDSGNAIVVWQQTNNGALTIAANHFAVGNNGVPNINPIAIAGANQSVNEQTLVNLDGSASFDQDGSITIYNWTQTAGTIVTLTAAATATPNFTAPIITTAETFSFELSVTDNANAISISTVNITVNPVNVLPVANAGIAQNVNEQTAVTLTGSGTDADGIITAYSWTQVSGTPVTLNTANTEVATFNTPLITIQQGVQTLVFELTVTDNEGATSTTSATSQVNVLVSPVNAAPVVNAGIDQTVNEQTAVSLTANATDTDGVISTYSWTQVSGLAVTLANANTANATFTAPVVLIQDGAQTIVLRVTVTDNEGATFSDDVSVVVNAVNAAPTVNAGLDQSVDEEVLVNLTAAANDSDGSIASYNWSQVNGVPVVINAATTANATFTAPTVLVQDGSQLITLRITATDNEGESVSDDIVITVNPVNAIPTVNAGIDQTVDELTSVSLTAAANDSDGSIATYSWTQVSGLPVTLITATTATTSFTVPTVLVQDGPQTLVLRVTATDNEGASITDDVSVIVNAVNASPVVNAGLDKTVDEQTTVTLSGSGSDTDGTVTYAWTQTAGPAVTLASAATPSISFMTPTVLVQDGALTLTFHLTVTDNETATVFDDVNVVVNPVNATPTANAGVDQNVNEQTGVTLTASANDSDGSIASYSWTQVSGLPVPLTNTSLAIATFTSPIVLVQDGPQSLIFRVAATDNEGSVITDDIVVTVNAVNASPVSNAGIDQNVDEKTAVSLTGTANDADGLITTYQWTQTGGVAIILTGASTANASFTSPVVLVQDGAQTLTFRLTVTDNETATVFDDMNIVVNPVNASPTVNAGVDQNINEQTAVTLTGSASDTDGSITTYQWTQTGGVAVILTGANTANASFTSPVVLVQDGAQTLTFRLTVTDNETATVFDDINIVVNPVNASPTVNAGVDQNVNEQTAVTLTGSASDTDGSITTYQWTQTSGVAVTLTNANTANAIFTSPIVLVQDGAQTLTFRLTITDNETATVFDDINVIVNPVNASPTANAGPHRAIHEQTPVTLSGSGADTDGLITTYQWTQITGPVVTLTNANTATSNFTTPVVLVADSPTVLTFRLTVTDNETATASSDVTIGVIAVNASPVASAGVDQIVNEQTAVSLTVSGTDSDGIIATYQWTQVNGLPVTLTTANTATASFTSPVVLVQDGDQILTFHATVTDNEGATHSDEMTVTVQAVNAHPTANAGFNQSNAEYTTVSLPGSGTDTDGTITAYQWTQTTGLPVILMNSTTATANFIAPAVYQDEVLRFNLVVTDNEAGVSAADSVSITLFSVNPDDDADGIPDLYEIANFGDLSRDGSSDFDNDGYSDLQEYLNGTNPLAVTLAAPTDLKAVAADTQVTLTWNNVTDAVAYKVYWDTTPNVTKSSNVISSVTSGYVHTGLTNGETYYYVVTTLSTGDESVVSNEVMAVPGKRAWQSAQAIDNGSTLYFYPHIVTNHVGQSVVVFEQFDGIAYSVWANIYTQDSGWGTPQAIETGDSGHVYFPRVAIDDNGNAIVVWEQFNGTSYNVWANIYDAQNAAWGIAEQIETSLTGGAEYFMPQVAMSQSGSAVVTWQKYDGLAISIWSSRYEMGTGWTQAEKLEANDLYSASLPQVDVDSAGNAVVVWEQYNTVSAAYSTWGKHFNVATGWSESTVISAVDNQSAYDAQVALSDGGRTIAVWEQFDGIRYNVWTNVAQNGVWGTAERVEYNTTGANEYFKPQVAIDKTGTATVVWQQSDGSHVSVWANRYVNGAWNVAQRIEANDITAIINPKVAMDEDGNAAAVWEQYDDTSPGSLISVWANRYTQGSGWGSAQALETNDTETMWFPEVSMDNFGNAKAVWWHSGITEDNILVAENILDTHPPIADAGPDQGGFVAKDAVTLDATGSSDTDGTITGYHWQQLSGVEVSINGKTTANPTFLAPRSQAVLELIFILTVTDNNGLTNTDTVKIIVGDTVAAAG